MCNFFKVFDQLRWQVGSAIFAKIAILIRKIFKIICVHYLLLLIRFCAGPCLPENCYELITQLCLCSKTTLLHTEPGSFVDRMVFFTRY